MDNLFKTIDLTNEEQIGNLNVESHSTVKSTKYFPIYKINNKKMIFKPLSKTKPFTTPFFAYSEVYWSYIIDKYFINSPRYFLARTNNNILEDKYYNQGVLVEFLNKEDEQLINLYDYFIKYPEKSINMKNYINYCMKNYEYDKILASSFIKNNQKIKEDLSYQILLSILREDQNYHYENVNLIVKNNSIELSSPIDFEFSTPFLFPDQKIKQSEYLNSYIDNIKIKYEDDNITKIIKQLLLEENIDYNNNLIKNICAIIKLYPNIVLNFINKLDIVIKDLPSIIIDDPDNYINKLNSDYWEVGHALYKENDIEKYKELKDNIKLQEINKKEVFNQISSNILEFSKFYSLTLKLYLLAYFSNINIDTLTIKEIYDKIGIDYNSNVEEINKKLLKIR